jgi:hypothetical protein
VPSEGDHQGTDALERVIGARIVGAGSALTCFAAELHDGSGLLVEAQGDDKAAEVAVSTPPASALPRLADAVCTVDWGWILGSTIRQATLAEGKLRLELEPAGPLTVSAAVWQGAPFLAFQPYRAPQS